MTLPQPRRASTDEPLQASHTPRRATPDPHERRVITSMFVVAMIISGVMLLLANVAS